VVVGFQVSPFFKVERKFVTSGRLVNAGLNTLSFVGVPALLDEHANALGVRVLPRACGLLRFSCGNPKLSRRDPDHPLEAKGKITHG
jgi:hypothetical protein